MKKVTVNGTVVLHQHYFYRDYLQIAALDLTRSNAPALWLLHWDPTQPVATRPLSLRKNGTWYTYGHDLTKNVTELYKADGTIATAYDYTPYGSVTATGIDQPIQWSSEVYDAELGLVYYNFRHYNPADGRWINRDPIAEEGGWNLYGFVRNRVIVLYDVLGAAQLPVPQEPIFFYPYNEETTNEPLVGFVTDQQIKKFYATLVALSAKTRDGQKCYKIYIHAVAPATIDLVTKKECYIKYITAHGSKKDGKDYVKLKDGSIAIADLNTDKTVCKGFGCNIGDNDTEVPQSYVMEQLISAIQKLVNDDSCPCKTICIFSGPVNH